MRRFAAVSTAMFLLLASTPIFAEGHGHIHVRCPPGVRIFLDGHFQGVTTKELDGITLLSVPVGVHLITAEKLGFRPHEDLVRVHARTVHQHWVQPFALATDAAPAPPGVKEAEAEVAMVEQPGLATLVVQSLPEKLSIAGLPFDDDAAEKSSHEWIAELVEGEYALAFTSEGKRLEHRVSLKKNTEVRLMVDFPEGRVFEIRSFPARSTAPRPKEPIGLDEVCKVSENASPGFVTVSTTPWSKVYFQGLELGETPLSRAVLPAGCVELRFVAPGGVEKTVRVWVESNQVRVFKFEIR